MNTKGDLGIMSHLGYLSTTPEFVRELWIENYFFSDR